MGSTDKLIDLAKSDDAMLKMYAAMELGFREDNARLIMGRVHHLLDNLPIGIVVICEEKGVVGINRRARDILRIGDDEDVLGLPCESFNERFGLFPGGDEVLSSLEETDRPLLFVQHLDGNTVVDVYIAAVKGTSEFVLLLNDITEQSREQEWLHGLLGAIGDAAPPQER